MANYTYASNYISQQSCNVSLHDYEDAVFYITKVHASI